MHVLTPVLSPIPMGENDLPTDFSSFSTLSDSNPPDPVRFPWFPLPPSSCFLVVLFLQVYLAFRVQPFRLHLLPRFLAAAKEKRRRHSTVRTGSTGTQHDVSFALLVFRGLTNMNASHTLPRSSVKISLTLCAGRTSCAPIALCASANCSTGSRRWQALRMRRKIPKNFFRHCLFTYGLQLQLFLFSLCFSSWFVFQKSRANCRLNSGGRRNCNVTNHNEADGDNLPACVRKRHPTYQSLNYISLLNIQSFCKPKELRSRLHYWFFCCEEIVEKTNLS